MNLDLNQLVKWRREFHLVFQKLVGVNFGQLLALRITWKT